MEPKRGQMWDTLIPWLVGIGLLLLMLAFYVVLHDKQTGALGFIKNMFKYR